MYTDWLYWYQILSPLFVTLAIRLWYYYASQQRIVWFLLGTLSASIGFHGLYLLRQSVLEGPQYAALPYLYLGLLTAFLVIGVQSYLRFGAKLKPKKTSEPEAGSNLE